MKFNVKIEFKGFEKIVEIYQERMRRAGEFDPEEAKRIHRFMLSTYIKKFRTQGKSEGTPWPGYGREPKYKAFKRSMTGNLEVLRWKSSTERLYPSLVKPGHPEHIWRASPDKIVFGTRVEHANALQQGGIGPFGEKFPARDILGLSPRTLKSIAKMRAEWIANTEK